VVLTIVFTPARRSKSCPSLRKAICGSRADLARRLLAAEFNVPMSTDAQDPPRPSRGGIVVLSTAARTTATDARPVQRRILAPLKPVSNVRAPTDMMNLTQQLLSQLAAQISRVEFNFSNICRTFRGGRSPGVKGVIDQAYGTDLQALTDTANKITSGLSPCRASPTFLYSPRSASPPSNRYRPRPRRSLRAVA